MTKLFSFLLSIVLIVFVLGFISRLGGGLQTRTNGHHTGFITALEQEGLLFKNYRVYIKTDLSSSQEDIYCLQASDDQLALALTEAKNTQQRVTVGYSKYAIILAPYFCKGDVIEEVEGLK